MPMNVRATLGLRRALSARAGLRALWGGLGLFIGLMAVIWVGLPLLPEETGLRFGMGYQAFFTAMLLLGVLFFWFLGRQSIPYPRGSAGVLASLAAVYVLTIGALVGVGVAYPQFPRPEPPVVASEDAVERGKDLFWNSNVGCFLCHTIEGTGGTRAPDLTHVASRAGQRVSGLTADQYLLEKVSAGATYRFRVPEYAPIMPPFEKMITKEQIRDLVAFLLTRQ
ncbi:MAG: cytochrome c [Chloroflexi bacterium]|nr:cytochrome c [Chloroflexota bacterium]